MRQRASIRDILKWQAKPVVRPVQIDGQMYYVAMLHPAQTADVKDMLFIDYLRECPPVVIQTLRRISKELH